MFKPLPQPKLLTFDLAKEAKKFNNMEKGKAADEKYLGEQQILAQKAERYARTGEAPWDDVDYEDPLTFDNWMDT